jgi:predicted phage replisome organizer
MTAKQGKRYYWLKLHENFFNQAVIRFLRKMPEGDSIVIIYLELLLISIKTDGYVRTDGLYDSMEKDLTLILDEDEMKIRLALAALEKAGLLVRGDGQFVAQMTQFPEMVGTGSETAGAQRMRNYRQKKAIQGSASGAEASQCDTAVTPLLQMRDGEREIEKEIEIDKENKEREGESKKSTLPRTPHGRYQNVFLSDQEEAELEKDFPGIWKDYLEQLSSFMASDGKTYQNHAAVIRRWINRDNRKNEAQTRKYSDGEEGSL